MAAWFAAGIAIIAAFIAMSNANSAKTQAGAALKQAHEAEKARKAAERQADSAKQQVMIMLDQLAETQADRNERINAEQRQAVLDVLATGRHWLDSLMPILDLCTARTDIPAEERRHVVAEFSRARAAYLTAITKAKLCLAAEPLRLVIELLESWIVLWPIGTVHITGSMIDPNGDVKEAALLEAFQARAQNQDALKKVQDLAERRFTVQSWDDLCAGSADS